MSEVFPREHMGLGQGFVEFSVLSGGGRGLSCRRDRVFPSGKCRQGTAPSRPAVSTQAAVSVARGGSVTKSRRTGVWRRFRLPSSVEGGRPAYASGARRWGDLGLGGSEDAGLPTPKPSKAQALGQLVPAKGKGHTFTPVTPKPSSPSAASDRAGWWGGGPPPATVGWGAWLFWPAGRRGVGDTLLLFTI